MKRSILIFTFLLFLPTLVYGFSAGTKTNVGTTAAPLTTTDTLISQVLVQADPDNTADVFIGDSTSQTIQLKAQDGITLLVNNLNQVYVKSASGTQTVNWVTR